MKRGSGLDAMPIDSLRFVPSKAPVRWHEPTAARVLTKAEATCRRRIMKKAARATKRKTRRKRREQRRTARE